MKNEKVVYILGAGFSKDAGGLLMKEFLVQKELGSKRKTLNQVYRDLKHFMNRASQGGLIGTDWNIEEFFNLVSEADLLDLEFKGLCGNSWKASKIYQNLVDCIVNELLLSMRKNLVSTSGQLPSHYVDFAERCLRKDVTIITFNWDHLPEWLLFTGFGSLDYCLDNVKKADRTIGTISKGVKLLKLHGSVNWLICENPNHPIHIYNSWQAHKVRLDYCSERRCGLQLSKMVIPPVWQKRDYAQRISELWEIAADELCAADKIVIIGYSLPIFDISAKYLLLLSAYMNFKVKVEIVNGRGFEEKSFEQMFKHAAKISNTNMFFKDYVASV